MTTPHQRLTLRNLRSNLKHKRCYCVGEIDTATGKVQWECKQGHRFSTTPKHWERSLRMLQQVTKQPDGYWSRRGGGASVLCPTCWRKRRQQFLEERRDVS